MENKKKVIIDTDPGIDDALALMLACKADDLDILGITVTAGNVGVDQGVQNALDILHLMGRDDIPVFRGAEKPLIKEMVNAFETHGNNGLGEVKLEKSPRNSQGTALEFFKETLENEDDVSIIALGPLTNLAELIRKSPESLKNIKELYLMGGTFRSPGNCSPVAEFNFWFDPDAAKIVFDELKKSIYMTGLDVTREILLTPNYATLIKMFDNNIANTIYDIVQHYIKFHWEQEGVLGCVINDPLTVAQILNNDICSGEEYHVDIITEGPTIGMSMVDEYGITQQPPNCTVYKKVDHKKFFDFFLKTLFPENEKEINKVLGNARYGT